MYNFLFLYPHFHPSFHPSRALILTTFISMDGEKEEKTLCFRFFLKKRRRQQQQQINGINKCPILGIDIYCGVELFNAIYLSFFFVFLCIFFENHHQYVGNIFMLYGRGSGTANGSGIHKFISSRSLTLSHV